MSSEWIKTAKPSCRRRFGGALGIWSLAYLRGLFSADGSVQGKQEKGISVRLASNQAGLFYRDVQILLLCLGIKSVLHQRIAGQPASSREYDCEAQHELIISSIVASGVFRELWALSLAASRIDCLPASSEYRRGPYRESFYATVEEAGCRRRRRSLRSERAWHPPFPCERTYGP